MKKTIFFVLILGSLFSGLFCSETFRGFYLDTPDFLQEIQKLNVIFDEENVTELISCQSFETVLSRLVVAYEVLYKEYEANPTEISQNKLEKIDNILDIVNESLQRLQGVFISKDDNSGQDVQSENQSQNDAEQDNNAEEENKTGEQAFTQLLVAIEEANNIINEQNPQNKISKWNKFKSMIPFLIKTTGVVITGCLVYYYGKKLYKEFFGDDELTPTLEEMGDVSEGMIENMDEIQEGIGQVQDDNEKIKKGVEFGLRAVGEMRQAVHEAIIGIAEPLESVFGNLVDLEERVMQLEKGKMAKKRGRGWRFWKKREQPKMDLASVVGRVQADRHSSPRLRSVAQAVMTVNRLKDALSGVSSRKEE